MYIIHILKKAKCTSMLAVAFRARLLLEHPTLSYSSIESMYKVDIPKSHPTIINLYTSPKKSMYICGRNNFRTIYPKILRPFLTFAYGMQMLSSLVHWKLLSLPTRKFENLINLNQYVPLGEETILQHLPKNTLTLHNFAYDIQMLHSLICLEPSFSCQSENMKS